ncbi:hypothetical protein GCM10027435_23870 [Haloparvum alkalitolerans]|uniref:hypothetical protein n=1 Tax=Haloparvum alkalitolerans TaxID=1042953 RepID=UPI003CFACE00
MPRVWLVDRQFDSKGLVRLTYATTDGERMHTTEIAQQRLVTGRGVTAGREVDGSDLAATDPENVERFAREADRMAEEHDLDDEV